MPNAENRPKSWTEMSFDMRLFFGFHACMVVLMLARFALSASIAFEIGVVCCAALIALLLSILNRKRHGWHWPGATWKHVLTALGVAALVLYFLGAALPGTTVLNPNFFPWLAAGGGFLVFGVLSALNIVQQSEVELQRHCGEGKQVEALPPTPPGPQLPTWKRAVASAFGIYFLAVWIIGVGFFWKFNSAFSHGSLQPTATQTETYQPRSQRLYHSGR